MAKNIKTRVMLFGTFDGLHKGHENLFKQARKLGADTFLIVSVARDKNVKKIKGKLPLRNESTRLRALKQNQFVDKAVLGERQDYLKGILKQKPHVIALGYDQTVYTKDLKKNLFALGLRVKIARLKAFKPHLFKSSIINKKVMV